jgi:hypothetical protein
MNFIIENANNNALHPSLKELCSIVLKEQDPSQRSRGKEEGL